MILATAQYQNIEKWIVALRSGKYRQVKGFLYFSKAYCCLGVKCDIDGMSTDYIKLQKINPFLELDSGLTRTEANILANLNDGNHACVIDEGMHSSVDHNPEEKQWSFNEIADLLEYFLEVVRIEDEVETDIRVREEVSVMNITER